MWIFVYNRVVVNSAFLAKLFFSNYNKTKAKQDWAGDGDLMQTDDFPFHPVGIHE
jgi:hypothetical protein